MIKFRPCLDEMTDVRAKSVRDEWSLRDKFLDRDKFL